MAHKNKDITLLILDVDETLIHATEKELDRPADFKIAEYFIYRRPFLNEFLEEIKKHFKVAIWSSASDAYVEEVVKQIIPQDYDLEFVYGNSRCTYRRNYHRSEIRYIQDSYSNHYHYVKSLKKLRRKGYSLDRMLIVDDSPHKCQDNYGNAIYPKEYNGDLADDELKLLLKYLLKLKDKTNVRRIEKRRWKQELK